VPLLVVAGAADNVTDPAMARRLYEEAGTDQKDLVVVEDGEHNGLHETAAVQSAYQALVQRVAGAPVVDSSGVTGPDGHSASGR
jgi:alpha-beta hydrolase superfamily lysophospholipase